MIVQIENILMPVKKDQLAVHDEFASCGHDIENCTCDQVKLWRGKYITNPSLKNRDHVVLRTTKNTEMISYVAHMLALNFRFSE